MTSETYDYDVKCRTCRTVFTVQLFNNHEKNLFMVDNRDWYCEKCKKAYFRNQTDNLSQAHKAIGFPELSGTEKQISWAEKIRSELINKAEYLRKSLTFEDDDQKERWETAFQMFLNEWREQSAAKWWIDQRRITVRDISSRVDHHSGGIAKG